LKPELVYKFRVSACTLKINPKEVGTNMKTRTPPPYAHGRAKDDLQKKILAHQTHKQVLCGTL
jgi:hypothetical protein